MNEKGTLYRVAAFSESADGGNPAGVWVGESLPAAEYMQQVATDVGFSETAFVAPGAGDQRTVRYYSPRAEVPFCGHATIAAGFVLGSTGDATTYNFSTAVGEVPVVVRNADGRVEVSLTSVDTQFKAADEDLLDEALTALRWHREELDPAIPPAVAYAGAWHLVLAASSLERLSDLNYDFDELESIMQRNDVLTLQLIWRETNDRFHARNPFPVGGVVEDPATGAAAAALGGYLRDSRLVTVPFTFQIRQGEVMGRPSLLNVAVPEAGGITVSGSAVEM